MTLKRTNLIPVVAASVLAASALGLAAAEAGEEWYSGIYLSASAGGQSRGRAAEGSTVWTDFDPGPMANLALGYRFSRYFRSEVEGTMFHNSAETLSAGPGLVGPAQGEAFLRAVLLNFYFDYPIKNTRFTPYFGGGVGMYKSYLVDLSNSTVKPFGFVFDGPSEGERFAYQLRAGVSYALTDQLDLWGGYRFFDGDKLSFSFSDVPAPGQTFTAGPKDTKIHGAELGIRWTF